MALQFRLPSTRLSDLFISSGKRIGNYHLLLNERMWSLKEFANVSKHRCRNFLEASPGAPIGKVPYYIRENEIIGKDKQFRTHKLESNRPPMNLVGTPMKPPLDIHRLESPRDLFHLVQPHNHGRSTGSPTRPSYNRNR